MSTENPPIVFIFFGPPGCGKGTQASALGLALGFPHISTGDLLRDQISKQTASGLEAKKYIDKGLLGPDSLVFNVLYERLAQADCQKGYILDGVPRNLSQVPMLEKYWQGKVEPLVFNFIIRDEEVINRLSKRLTCQNCHRIYHQEKSPPLVPNVCDFCKGPLYQRSDDTEEVIYKRLKVYYEQTQPVEEYYAEKSRLVSIDANQDKEAVFKQVLKYANAHMILHQ